MENPGVENANSPFLETKPTVTTEVGFFQNLTNKLSENKKVIIGVLILIIIAVGAFYYKKYVLPEKEKDENEKNPKDKKKKKEKTPKNDSVKSEESEEKEDKEESPKNDEVEQLQRQLAEQQMFTQQVLQQKQMVEEQLRQQMQQQINQQMQQQLKPKQQMVQPVQTTRSKLQHPGRNDSDNDSELMRLQSNEDPRIGQHNLTAAEIAEIRERLESN